MTDFTVKLTLSGDGFMTSSTPSYNQNWRVRANTNAAFYKYPSIFGDDDESYALLDYDGLRTGTFQKEQG